MSFKPRYIKAEEAEERIVSLWRKEKGAYADAFNTAIDACQTVVLDMYDNSSPDVVHVVRCKDCKWWTKQEASLQGRCDAYGMYPTGEWYCARGERKDDGTD